jgi:hypothetical protein
MTEVPPGEGGGGNGGGEGGGGGGGGGGAAPSWRDSLPDTLKADASLANFADIGALAAGYVETKRLATARVPDFKTDDGLKVFADAVRPADAAGYDIPVPEGHPTQLADAFRAFAHERGMPPGWAKETAEFFNTQSAALIEAETAASQADVDKFKAEMGATKFGAKLEAVQRMLPQLGVTLDDADLTKLDAKLGSGNLLKFLFAIHDRIGDPAPIGEGGGEGGGGMSLSMTPEQAKETWDQKRADPAWRKAAKTAGSPEAKEFTRLSNLITAGRAAKKSP